MARGGSRISIKQGDNWERMGRNNCTEGIHSVTMNSSLVGSLDLVQVSLQHTSDIKVELGSQEMAREHIGIGSTEIKKSKLLGGQGAALNPWGKYRIKLLIWKQTFLTLGKYFQAVTSSMLVMVIWINPLDMVSMKLHREVFDRQ